MRTRLKSGESKERRIDPTTGASQIYTSHRYIEIMRDSQKGPGPCDHIKLVRPFRGVFYSSPGEIYLGEDLITPIYESYYLPKILEACRDVVDKDLKGSQFEILTFAAELDETIAMFSKKFLTSRLENKSKGAYGEFTWGIQPFISDFKALLKAVQDSMTKLPPSASRSIKRLRRFSFMDPWETSGIPLDVVGTIRVRGERKFIIPEHSGRIQKALWYLDQIGFHPDIKTVWDVLPLSFAVDYLIPVGDIIESLHPRGWLRSASPFVGEYSFKGQVGVGHKLAPNNYNIENWCYYHVYHRGTLPAFDTPSLPEWKAPSLKEIFNIAYLTTTLKNFL